MNLNERRALALALAAGLASFGRADFFTGLDTTLSAVIDTSNLTYSVSDYDVFYQHSGDDPDTYINSLNLVPGSNWDTDIDLQLPAVQMTVDYGNSVYVFGTPITGDQSWTFNQVPVRYGAIADVDPGLYDFSVEFIGGTDDMATDVLGTVNFELEVFEYFDVTAVGTATPSFIYQTQQSSLSMTVTNHMMNRDFITTTWYVAGFSDGSTSLQFDGFFGNWFGHVLAAGGGSRTDAHSKYTATLANAAGTYLGNNGVVGGLYSTDFHFIRMDPDTAIEVATIPEPATLAVLGLGAAGLLRRRKSTQR